MITVAYSSSEYENYIIYLYATDIKNRLYRVWRVRIWHVVSFTLQ